MAVPLTCRALWIIGCGWERGLAKAMYHTLARINNQSEPWDYFPFNDRDFTSVAS